MPTLSVIVPTYNRWPSLRRALESLQAQSFPMDQLSVIVVDDGSTDETPGVAELAFPFTLRYARQNRCGATAARNLGATLSQAELLVFIDDDVTISPHSLTALAAACTQQAKTLAMGTINKRNRASTSVYTPVVLTMAAHILPAQDGVEFHPADCNTELLACRREDFFEIGMFQDPTEGNGWPNWDDVDFGFRAHLKGYRLMGASGAAAEHWDDTITDRTLACRRFFRAGRSAVWLLNRHPELGKRIPMLQDKLPPAWGHDPAPLLLRKLIRRGVSSQPMVATLAHLTSLLERHYPSPRVLRRLYYLLHGAHLLQGYQAGLREFKLNHAH